MPTVPVVLSEDLAEFASRKAAELGLSGPGEYLAELADEQRLREARFRIEEELLKGVRSRSFITVDAGWWERKKAEWLSELDAEESA